MGDVMKGNRGMLDSFEPLFEQCREFEAVVQIDSIVPELRVGVDMPLVGLRGESGAFPGIVFLVRGMRDVVRSLTATPLPFSSIMRNMDRLFVDKSNQNIWLMEADSDNSEENLLAIGLIEPEVDVADKVIRFKMSGRGACQIRHGVVFTRPSYNNRLHYSSS